MERLNPKILTCNVCKESIEEEIWIKIMKKPVHFHCANKVITYILNQKQEWFDRIYPIVGIWYFRKRKMNINASVKFTTYLLSGIRPLPAIQESDLEKPMRDFLFFLGILAIFLIPLYFLFRYFLSW